MLHQVVPKGMVLIGELARVHRDWPNGEGENSVRALPGTSPLEQVDPAFLLKPHRPECATNKWQPIG